MAKSSRPTFGVSVAPRPVPNAISAKPVGRPSSKLLAAFSMGVTILSRLLWSVWRLWPNETASRRFIVSKVSRKKPSSPGYASQPRMWSGSKPFFWRTTASTAPNSMLCGPMSVTKAKKGIPRNRGERHLLARHHHRHRHAPTRWAGHRQNRRGGCQGADEPTQRSSRASECAAGHGQRWQRGLPRGTASNLGRGARVSREGPTPYSIKRPKPEWQYLQVIKNRCGSRLRRVSIKVVYGQADEVISSVGAHTAYVVERTNLSSRQMNGRLVRKMLSYSKQLDALEASCAWEDWVYNLGRPLKPPAVELERRPGGQQRPRWKPVSPAMAAGLTDHVWSVKELLSTVVRPQVVNTK